MCQPESQKADSEVAPPKLITKIHPSHPVTFTRASPNLQSELQFAIDTPLIPPAWLNGDFPLPKTSDTHPIMCVCLLPFPICLPFSILFSVSAMVPEELLSSVSLHISLAGTSSPTIFNIHPAFSLHRLVSVPDSILTAPSVVPAPASSDHSAPTPRPISIAPLPRSAAPSRTHLQIWSRVSMKSALQSALATNIRQPAEPLAPAPRGSVVPRLPPLTIGNIDLIGEIFSTSQLQQDVEKSSGTGLQARHERTYSVPFSPSQGTFADSPHVIHYLPNKRSHVT